MRPSSVLQGAGCYTEWKRRKEDEGRKEERKDRKKQEENGGREGELIGITGRGKEEQ